MVTTPRRSAHPGELTPLPCEEWWIQHWAVADPGFSWGGGANSQSGCANLFFCRKRHENERVWNPRTTRVPATPVDPPMLRKHVQMWILYASVRGRVSHSSLHCTSVHFYLHPLQGRNPGFLVGGGANPPELGGATYKFSQKLHEMKKILVRGGRGAPPLDPPLHWSHLFIYTCKFPRLVDGSKSTSP